MADVLNPVTFLGDLAEMFADAARESGIPSLDPELCRTFAEGLTEAAETLQASHSLCTAHGLIERTSVQLDAPLCPAERAQLARMANAAAEGNVVPFPRIDRARSALAGGSAA